VLVALLGAASGVTLLSGSPLLQRQAITMLTYVVIVVGLYVFVGNSGVLSFGHITFVTVGAYVTAFSTMPPAIKHAVFSGLPGVVADLELVPIWGLLLGAVAATGVAAVVAFPINRLPGVTLGLAMFALLLATNVVTRQATALVTGGQTSVFGIPRGTTMLSAYVLAAAAIVVAFLYQRSRGGLLLRAAREDEAAASSSGIKISRIRIPAFLLSAFLMGLGGGIFVQFLGALNPDVFFFESTLVTLAMLVVGGVGSLTGAVVGTLLVSAVLAWLRELENGFSILGATVPDRPGLTSVGLGVMMLVILLRRPQGLTGSQEIPPFSRWIRRPRGRTAPREIRMTATPPVDAVSTPTAVGDGGSR
jgi:branched-chain amino acid transport system permease protein